MQRLFVPRLGPSVPRRGNAISAGFGRAVLRLAGWSFAGSVPDVAKAVVIVAPHTSNWDFLIGVAAMFALGLRVVFLGKHTLFRWPLGAVMRWLGGIPVDRRLASGVVEATVGLLGARERMILALAPEGTRRRVERWKTGFYHVARAADVPILPIAFDWTRRQVRIGELFYTTGDLEGDVAALERFFAGLEGRRRG
ncbi:MAG: lysophospholipid acyltransferase family protein [Thermoanaerobaculales bacterium]|jgi:1-acyl-sn-glycerol-3-phosphate acyltransferase|nr:lysophospholipid acyltransferase family protein [Thermoanaerobaculales bacterium]